MTPLPSARTSGRRAPMAEINVTPMVDVMLVLLIIFMVTAPLLVAGVPVQLPQSKAGALDQEQKPLAVSIDAGGKIFVDKAEVADVGLSALFAKARAQGGVKAPQVFVRADGRVPYAKVAAVMGELNHAGLNRVALVTTGGRNDAK